MGKNKYENFSKKDLILRDHLAIDRTILANERTLLAYVRTSLAVIAVGATLIYFSSIMALNFLGIVSIIVGISILFIGFIRYKKMVKSIGKAR